MQIGREQPSAPPAAAGDDWAAGKVISDLRNNLLAATQGAVHWRQHGGSHVVASSTEHASRKPRCAGLRTPQQAHGCTAAQPQPNVQYEMSSPATSDTSESCADTGHDGTATCSATHMYECIVCLETKPLSSRQPWPRLATGNGEVLRAGDCGHPTCTDCMRMFLTTRVSEGSCHRIRCPHEGCKNELFESDVARMVEAPIAKRFAELRAQDYSRRAATIVTDAEEGTDYAMLWVLYETARICPRCSVVIQRSAGCDHFYCMCGHQFNWSSAPRAVGGGKKRYGRTIRLAESLKVPLAEAEMYGDAKMMSKCLKLAQILETTVEEAVELHKKARNGDQEARGLIRAARQGDRLELARMRAQHSARLGSESKTAAPAAA